MEICVQTMRGYPDTLALAQWCEAEGIPALAVADHYLSGPKQDSEGYDQLVILGGIARETSKLELCTLVSPLTFRHPAVHLKAAVTLDQMSGGRFSLGIGAGWMELEHDSFGLELYPMTERFDRLEDTLGYLKAALDGSGGGFEGTYYRLAEFEPQPRPGNLRIIVGGGGKRRTPDLAGRFADEFNAFPDKTTPMDERVGRCLESARDAGRDPEAILLSTAFPAFVAQDEATADAMIAKRAARTNTDAAGTKASLDSYEIPHGTPEKAVRQYEALASSGISRIYLQLAGNDLEEVAGAVDAARRCAALAEV